jgi:hypothetical protein
VAQLARRLLLAEARSSADRPERPAHIRRIELCPVRCREDEPVVLPQNARRYKPYDYADLVGDTGIEPVTCSV